MQKPSLKRWLWGTAAAAVLCTFAVFAFALAPYELVWSFSFKWILRGSGVEKAEPDGIRVAGEINALSAERFIALLTPDVRRVYLSSPGGETSAALKMAAAIKERDLDIVVDGPCASACAIALFLAGKNKVVTKNGMLLLHWNPQQDRQLDAIASRFPLTALRLARQNKALHSLRQSHFGLPPIPQFEPMITPFWKAMGMDPAFFSVAEALVTCRASLAVRGVYTEDPHSPNSQRATTDALFEGPGASAFWLPSPAAWKAAGLRDADFQWLPASHQEAEKVAFESSLIKLSVILTPDNRPPNEADDCPKFASQKKP